MTEPKGTKKQGNLARFLYTLSALTYAGMGFLFSYLFVSVWQTEGFTWGSLIGRNIMPVIALWILFLLFAVFAYIIDPKE